MPAGRPPFWDDPEAFNEKSEHYFAEKEMLNQTPTWSGLARYLGFESRKSLDDYGKKPEFSYSIKKALLRIEEIYEQNLFGRNPAGSIFALKNFGWRDKQEIEQSGGISIKYQDPGDYIYPSQDQSNSGIPESI
jgi:hypothetical protein